jgi:hypothetical protein
VIFQYLRGYWKSFIELTSVCSTPRMSGMPTKPHASKSWSGVVPCCLAVVMFDPPFYARAPAAPRKSPSFLLVFMWKRASTALTRKLQMNPTTSNPAMMYIVVL